MYQDIRAIDVKLVGIPSIRGLQLQLNITGVLVHVLFIAFKNKVG